MENEFEVGVESLIRYSEKKQAALKTLMESGENREKLQLLQEEYESTVDCILANYSEITDHNGKTYDIMEVMQEVKEGLRKDFTRLMGVEFQPASKWRKRVSDDSSNVGGDL